MTSMILQYFNLGTKGYFYDKNLAPDMKLNENNFNLKVDELMIGGLGKSNWDLKSQLEKIEVPTFIVQGRQDPIDLQTAREINMAIKNSELQVIEKCGHFPWIEQPEHFYQLIRDFMAR